MISGEEHPFDSGVMGQSFENTGFNMRAIGASFVERTEWLAEFAKKEFAAYEMFRRVTSRIGEHLASENELVSLDSAHPGYMRQTIYYPPVKHNMYFENEIKMYHIRLSEVRFFYNGQPISVTPMLGVYEDEKFKLHGFDPEHADVYYERTELDALCGFSDVASFADIGMGLMAPNEAQDSRSFEDLSESQDGFVRWLLICAENLHMGPQYISPISSDIIQQCGGLGFSLDS